MHATCSSHVIVLNLIVIKYGVQFVNLTVVLYTASTSQVPVIHIGYLQTLFQFQR